MAHYLAERKEGELLFFSDASARHIRTVMRLRIGDEFEAVHGGHLYAVTVREENPLTAAIIHEIHEDRELPSSLYLAFAMLKGGHDELILQKGTELGVAAFLPLLSERTIIRLDKEKDKAAKRDRYQKIVEGASEQCRRLRVPEVQPIQTLVDVLRLPAEHRLFAYEKEAFEGVTLVEAIRHVKPGDRVVLLIGPEGGWSEAEAERILKAGYAPISLGKRILRAETAAIYGAAVFAAEVER